MSLKEKVENHPIYVFGTALVFGFGAGFTTSEVIQSIKTSNVASAEPNGQNGQGNSSINPSRKEPIVLNPGEGPSNEDEPDTNKSPDVEPKANKPPDVEPEENINNPSSWTRITKAKGPLTFTFDSAKIEDSTLAVTLYISNSKSEDIVFGIFLATHGMYKTIAMVGGKKLYPASAEIGGKPYEPDEFVNEDCPRKDKLLVLLKFEGVPKNSNPSSISVDYHYTDAPRGMEIDTQTFKYNKIRTSLR